MRVVAVVIVMLCACVTDRRLPRKPPASPARCADKAGLSLDDTPEVVHLECKDDRYDCSGRVRVELLNCTEVSWKVDEYRFRPPGNPPRFKTYAFGDSAVAPGAQWQRALDHDVSESGVYTHELMVSSSTGQRLTLRRFVQVVNAARDRAIAECQNCNGDWDRHGMMQLEGCLCRTSDQGKTCSDGDHCEGKCLQTDDGLRCSQHIQVLGCHTYVPNGWSRRSEKQRQRLQTLCVD